MVEDETMTEDLKTHILKTVIGGDRNSEKCLVV
jgi:hypothetical protein